MRTIVIKLAIFMLLLACSVTVAQVLPIVNGGTGATTASQALTNLGGAALSGATFTGPISAQIINNTCMADQQAGADMGAKIAACNTQLVNAGTGGIIDATGFQGTQYASVGFTLGAGVPTTTAPPATTATLKLGYVTLISGGEIVMSPYTHIQGQAVSISGGPILTSIVSKPSSASQLAIVDMQGCAHCTLENVNLTTESPQYFYIPKVGVLIARNPAPACAGVGTGYNCAHGQNIIHNISVTGYFQDTAFYNVDSEVFRMDNFYGDVYDSAYYPGGVKPKYCMAFSQTDVLGLGVYSASTMTSGVVEKSECWYYPTGASNSANIYFGGAGNTQDWVFKDSYLAMSDGGAFVEIQTNENSSGNLGSPLTFDNVDGETDAATYPNYGYYIHGPGANPSVTQLTIKGATTMGVNTASGIFIYAPVTLHNAYINSVNYMSSAAVTSSLNTVYNSTIILPYQNTTITYAFNSTLVGGASSNCGNCGMTVTGSGSQTGEVDPVDINASGNTYYRPTLINPTITGTMAASGFNATASPTSTYQMNGANVLLYNGGVLYLEGANYINIGYPGSCYVVVYETSSTPMISECGLTSIGPMKAAGSSAAVGYTTGSGAGCAVTQGTSRTTGVTCTGNTGAITLYNTAGSISYTTFTVTDSSVAATDTVQMNPYGGTNTYLVYPPTVASGSFKVTFNTTGGTAVDAPVFNFTVIKGSSN